MHQLSHTARPALIRLVRRCIVVAFIGLAACSTIGPFSQVAYQQATAIKAEAMTIMSNAADDYGVHATEVKALRLDVEKAYEYARGRPKNEVSTKQWEIIRDPNGHSLGGFLKRWEGQKTLNQAFVDEAKKVVADDLDQVIGLESGKDKGST